ncbi:MULTISPECIES: protein-glutamate O-methyltransferase CheR [Methylomonas]|uniref:Chemotaxis protein methyltransferase n=1 Tax=Methylomonas defluvii TaxID=3045149 RepID=A0ABU4UBD3_9GAMM|nr:MULTISPECIES: protein-glutamate O-methyltransferase CheR [unclassified Methylomonas]MDX8126282.1 protein-glutamate O-methyltransferase CheR [Methylomonas sp. OY6]NOV28746.1 protein-glutamate O-methyltransferase CheR [Methylomonas sp. ZR1]
MKEKAREFEYTQADFDVLRKISNQYSGILVPDDKFDMFYSRLSKRVRMLGFTSFKQYCHYLKNNPDTEFTEFINAVTTNLTSFFRENHHFEYLSKTVVPGLLKKHAGTKQIKVWSAGCSTGEEPYSLAMTLKESVPADWTINILATDLDTNVLATAAAGIYMADRVTGIAEQRLKRWFQKGVGGQANKVRVKPELKELIEFKQLNLMQEWPLKGYFDFIFCRNVLIYFDRETKAMLANRYCGLLEEGSYLFIGHSESLHQLDTGFSLIGNTIYRKSIK